MKWVKTLFAIILILSGILFATQNQELVTLRFGLYPVEKIPWIEVREVPLFLVVLCSVALGILLGGIGDLYRRLQLRRTLRQNQKMIERLEKELHSFRGPSLDPSIPPKNEI